MVKLQQILDHPSLFFFLFFFGGGVEENIIYKIFQCEMRIICDLYCVDHLLTSIFPNNEMATPSFPDWAQYFSSSQITFPKTKILFRLGQSVAVQFLLLYF